MTRYVIGFLFNADKSKVLLIEKNRPDWQAGKLNGPGGHIEFGESPRAAVQREILEETGNYIPSNKWYPVCKMQGTNWVVHVLQAVTIKLSFENKTDEECRICNVDWLPKNVLPNIPWLLAMCNDKNIVNRKTTITYH